MNLENVQSEDAWRPSVVRGIRWFVLVSAVWLVGINATAFALPFLQELQPGDAAEQTRWALSALDWLQIGGVFGALAILPGCVWMGSRRTPAFRDGRAVLGIILIGAAVLLVALRTALFLARIGIWEGGRAVGLAAEIDWIVINGLVAYAVAGSLAYVGTRGAVPVWIALSLLAAVSFLQFVVPESSGVMALLRFIATLAIGVPVHLAWWTVLWRSSTALRTRTTLTGGG
jgi:hypothetical protein